MGAMKVWDGTTWQTVAPFSERASCFVGPDQPAGVAYAGDLWWDTDDTQPTSGQELAYNQITSSVAVAVNTEATALEIISSGARSYDGTPICIDFFTPRIEIANTAGAQVLTLLWDGATNLGWMSQIHAPGTLGLSQPVRTTRRLTPSAGTHTYRIMAWALAGQGTIYAGTGASGLHVPAFLRITRV